ncbi:hypothetical protein GCM10010376_34940 [Streptomyces violaceusniger]
MCQVPFAGRPLQEIQQGFNQQVELSRDEPSGSAGRPSLIPAAAIRLPGSNHGGHIHPTY